MIVIDRQKRLSKMSVALIISLMLNDLIDFINIDIYTYITNVCFFDFHKVTTYQNESDIYLLWYWIPDVEYQFFERIMYQWLVQ
jgi:hypothetical protein